MRATSTVDSSEIVVRVERTELVALVGPDSLLSRMAAQNPGAYERAWGPAKHDGLLLHISVGEARRMATLPRVSPSDHKLFSEVNAALCRKCAL
jgi:hypothetical protein